MSKREAPEAAAEAAAEKRCRKAIDEMADELLCPITQELPVDPVIAADGRVYERSAIERWIIKGKPASVRSPVTNAPMGTRLLSAVQVRNSIKSMVQSGVISGAKAEAWRARLAEEERVAEWRRLAEGGDAYAMFRLGLCYEFGRNGLEIDLAQAFRWFERGALEHDHPSCLALYGNALCKGQGVAKNLSRGLVALGRASALGSKIACFQLGLAYEKGSFGLKPKEAEARRWYSRMASCNLPDCSGTLCARVDAWLREHPAQR